MRRRGFFGAVAGAGAAVVAGKAAAEPRYHRGGLIGYGAAGLVANELPIIARQSDCIVLRKGVLIAPGFLTDNRFLVTMGGSMVVGATAESLKPRA